jgi:uncharacterized Tic20 family protein
MTEKDGRPRPSFGVTVPPGPPPSRDVNLAAAVHLLGGILAVAGLSVNLVVLAAVVPSLWAFLASRSRGGFVREEARAALNFQLTWVGVTLVLQIASFVVVGLLFGRGLFTVGAEIALLFLLVELLIAVFDLIASIVAMNRARRGGGFRYPLSVNLVK